MIEEQQKHELEKLEANIESDYQFHKTFSPIVHVLRGTTIVIGIAALGAFLLDRINHITIFFIYAAIIDQIVTRSMEAWDQYKAEKRMDKNYETFHQMKKIRQKGGETENG